LKLWYPTTTLHGVTTKKTSIWSVTALKMEAAWTSETTLDSDLLCWRRWSWCTEEHLHEFLSFECAAQDPWICPRGVQMIVEAEPRQIARLLELHNTCILIIT
jgi:hypothetical protein